MDKKTPILYLRDFPSVVAMIDELKAMVDLLKKEKENGMVVDCVETQVEKERAYAIVHLIRV